MSDITFNLYDNLYIQIDTNNYDYLKGIESELTEYVKGYMFTPKFKKGHWSGKVSLFKRQYRTFPYGLLLKVLRYTKKEWSELTYEVSDDVRGLFKGIPFDNFKDDLVYKPYDYQRDAIKEAVTRSKGICKLPTASGKSLVITYIIKHIHQYHNDYKSLIVVPTLSLVDQFIDDMEEYGMDVDKIGRVNASHKEFDKDIVVSTWQSMKNNLNELYRYNVVIIDETHSVKATKLMEILENCHNATFRIGMTGTMPTDPLENMNVRSLLGPLIIQLTGKSLADMGYISHCTIKTLKIHYNNSLDDKKNDYTFVRDEVFKNTFRMGVIKEIVKNTNNSVLILIEKVEKEGTVLEKMLSESFPDKKIIFISGKDKTEIREKTRKEMNISDNMVVIATYPVFQQGINIKSLRTIVLASSTKSFIRVIQSLGRTLRKHVSKDIGGAELYDLCDQTKYLRDHAEKRERHYIKEGHEILEFELREKSGVCKIC